MGKRNTRNSNRQRSPSCGINDIIVHNDQNGQSQADATIAVTASGSVPGSSMGVPKPDESQFAKLVELMTANLERQRQREEDERREREAQREIMMAMLESLRGSQPPAPTPQLTTVDCGNPQTPAVVEAGRENSEKANDQMSVVAALRESQEKTNQALLELTRALSSNQSSAGADQQSVREASPARPATDPEALERERKLNKYLDSVFTQVVRQCAPYTGKNKVTPDRFVRTFNDAIAGHQIEPTFRIRFFRQLVKAEDTTWMDDVSASECSLSAVQRVFLDHG